MLTMCIFKAGCSRKPREKSLEQCPPNIKFKIVKKNTT